MIPVDSLLYKIDQKLNKLSTNEHQQIQIEDKILALNEAQIKLIKQKVDNVGIVSGAGSETFKRKYEDIQGLIEDYRHHPLDLILTNPILNQWSANVNNLVPQYMFYVDSYILANKGRCKDHVIWINRDLAKHGDIQFILNNVNYKPSFEYQETFNSLSSDEISVYTDGTFIPGKIYMMYVRYPLYIDKGGYVHLDGTSSVDTNCELEAYLEDTLVDMAVQNLAIYTENQMAVQGSQLRIQTS